MRCKACDVEMPEGTPYVYRRSDSLKRCVPCADEEGITYKPSRRYIKLFGEPLAVAVEVADEEPQHEDVALGAVDVAEVAVVSGDPAGGALAPGDSTEGKRVHAAHDTPLGA